MKARLAWAFVAERPEGGAAGRISRADAGTRHPLVAVTEYAHLAPRERPAAYCPVCLERVTLRLGRRNRHHYGHRPESDCAAGTGEGALHLAAKLHLAAELRGASGALRIRRVCARVPAERGTERCERASPEPWEVEWDEVALEYAIPSARADLMLLRAGREVAAVEVLASHAVDAAKAERYRSLGVPWIEVPARGVLPENGVGWTGGDPLPVVQDGALHPERWRCPRHEGLHRGMLEHARTGTHILAGRVVHLYRADGGRSAGEPRTRAFVVHMLERRQEGRTVEAWLERSDTHGRLGAPVRASDAGDARRRLHHRFLGWVRWMRGQGVAADSPMRWAAPEALAGWRGSAPYPERLRWDGHAGCFLAAPNLPPVAWPRLPAPEGGPDPVLGYPACAWSEHHPPRASTLHAIHGPVWATLRVRGRTAEGEVAHLAAHLHDGRRWRVLAGAPWVATVAAPGPEAWTALLARFARRLAARPADELLAGRLSDALPAQG